MAVTVDWSTRIITIPQADLTFVSGTLYSIDTNALRLELKDIEDDDVGMAFPDTHQHNTEVTIAGVTYARTFEIINNYRIEFEDGQYAVRLEGSNNNMFDEGVIVRNQVSIIPTNSAGLQIVSVGSGLSMDQDAKLTALDTYAQTDASLRDGRRELVDIAGLTYEIIYDPVDDVTEISRRLIRDNNGSPVTITNPGDPIKLDRSTV